MANLAQNALFQPEVSAAPPTDQRTEVSQESETDEEEDNEEEDEEEEEQAPLPTLPTTCDVCEEANSKYRCPRCDQRTCSLACIKRHKAETGCTGERDRLAYVSMKEFDDRTLLSDFRLLEDVQRAEDVARRHRPSGCRPELPPPLASLVHQAQRRGVRLLLMPPGLHKRKTNTTRYVNRNFKMMWRVEWHFPSAASAQPASASTMPTTSRSAVSVTRGAAPAVHTLGAAPATSSAADHSSLASSTGVTLADEKVSEDSTLVSLLQPHLQYTVGSGAQLLALRQYADVGATGLTLLLRQEGCPANNIRYYALDSSATVATALAHKTIVEYPVITVVLPHEVTQYKLVDPPLHPLPPTQQQEWARTKAFRAHIQAQAQLAKERDKAKAAAEAAAAAAAEGTPQLPEAGQSCGTDLSVSGAPLGTLPGPPQLPPPPIRGLQGTATAGFNAGSGSDACHDEGTGVGAVSSSQCTADAPSATVAPAGISDALDGVSTSQQSPVECCGREAARPSGPLFSHPPPENEGSLPPAKRHQSMGSAEPHSHAVEDSVLASGAVVTTPMQTTPRINIAPVPVQETKLAQESGVVVFGVLDANEIEI